MLVPIRARVRYEGESESMSTTADGLPDDATLGHGRAEYSIAWTALAIGRPGIAAEHAARYAELIAEHLTDQVEDPETRAVVVERMGRQPWFGLA